MVATEQKPKATDGQARRPLENGEAMHSREFLQRYEGLPQVKKAELIEGIVYMGSPVSYLHAKPDNLIQLWLGAYAAKHPDTEALTNITVVLDTENTFQPDALLRRLPEQGGLTRPTEEGYLAGAPELVVEIAASSASIDLRDKFRAYCRNGVREYIVWRVTENRLDWFCLEGEEYAAQVPDTQGRLSSRVFPGLTLPIAALLAFNAAEVLAAVSAKAPQSHIASVKP
jgi:Uma2 family endonuclease